MIYHVTVERQLITTQQQTITVEAASAVQAYDLAYPMLDEDQWHSDPVEILGDTYEVECRCDAGWVHRMSVDKNR